MKRYLYIPILICLISACSNEPEETVVSAPVFRVQNALSSAYTGNFRLLDTYWSDNDYYIYKYDESVTSATTFVYPLGYQEVNHRYYFYTRSENEKLQYSHHIINAQMGDRLVKSYISTPVIPMDSLHADLRMEQPLYEQGIASVHYSLDPSYSFCRKDVALSIGTSSQVPVVLTSVVSKLQIRVLLDSLLRVQTDAICAMVYNVYTEIDYATGKPQPDYCMKGSYIIGTPDDKSTAAYALQLQNDTIYSGSIYTFPSDTVEAVVAAKDESAYNRPVVALFLKTKAGNYYSLSHAHLPKALLAGRETNAVIKITNIEETNRVTVTTNSFYDLPWTEQDDFVEASEACSIKYQSDTCSREGGAFSIPVRFELTSYAKDFKIKWSASTETGWITNVENVYRNGTDGTGTLQFNCYPNTSGSMREGSITVRYWYDEAEVMEAQVPVVQY